MQCQTTSLAALLDAGADINQLSPSTRETALVVSACYGHALAIRILLDRGANPFLEVRRLEPTSLAGALAS